MKAYNKALLISVLMSTTFSVAQIKSFQHVVIVVQENRTPDNLFQGLCSPPYGTSASCNIRPSKKQYNIQTNNWLDKLVNGGTINPLTVTLQGTFDLSHSHTAFTQMCDLDSGTGACKMDGAGLIQCAFCKGVTQPQFRYVDNSSGILNPYLTLATQFGWSNFMFQTNQGPSFPAHQYLFAGTSAPTAADDHIGTFASENPVITQGVQLGCIGDPKELVQLIDANGVEDPKNTLFPCFEHQTLSDLLEQANITWRYYAPNPGTLWTAPNGISHICVPVNGHCTGADWINNVDLHSPDFLKDAMTCNLRQVSWVIPSGPNSDHSSSNDGGGPSWVASVVNAVGNSTCKNPDGTTYWDSTAIIITWDDWGGWYDHAAPTFLAYPQGAYQIGFRVPMIVVSAYTPQGYISNEREEFGSILRFTEHNFGIAQGALTFADERATNELNEYFDIRLPPRSFTAIPSPKDIKFFLNDKRPGTDPDND
jgi:phospholipase C